MTEIHIELRGVSKSYGGVHAVRDVSLKIERGTVHALVGENGAGKSTISNIIAGAIGPTHGELLVDGESVLFRSPRAALAKGIAMIEQELAMVPGDSVIDNVFMGFQPRRFGFIDRRRQRKSFDDLLAMSGFRLKPGSAVGTLRVADQQRVEILRALARNAEFIIMDEPTAPLTKDEAQHLYAVIDTLRKAGTTILYISHFLDEVLQLADTVTVMRNGLHVSTAPVETETRDSLVRKMLGRQAEGAVISRQRQPSGDAILEARGIVAAGRFDDVSLKVHPGEILGIAGLIGSGRTEVVRALAGADRIDSGQILLRGREMRWRSPRAAIASGVVLLPESRKEQGLVLTASVADNVVLTRMRGISRLGLVRRALLRTKVGALMDQLDIRAASMDVAVATLSGGNQQKVLLAKCLNAKPAVLLIDEPTRGVDIGAKGAIHRLIHQLADEGVAVVVVSSEIEEVQALADRLIVMSKGRVSACFDAASATPEGILSAAFGTGRTATDHPTREIA